MRLILFLLTQIDPSYKNAILKLLNNGNLYKVLVQIKRIKQILKAGKKEKKKIINK
ncbi:hypothetical protein CM15mP43_08420 [bacterium]|nr:MAG: hypothetical protein CM15mP43_08420 [bacterium]